MLVYVCIGLAVAVVAQSLVIVRVSRALNSIGRFGVSPRLIRLHVGLESVEDLWADLAGALESARNK